MTDWWVAAASALMAMTGCFDPLAASRSFCAKFCVLPNATAAPLTAYLPDASTATLNTSGRSLAFLAAAGRVLRAEDLDHADDRSEEAEKRRDRGDGAEGIEEALELDGDRAPGILHRVLEHLARAALVQERCGEDAADERTLLEAADEVRRHSFRLVLANRRGEHVARRDQRGAQRPEALADDGEGDDRGGDDEPDRPSGRFDYRQHCGEVPR